MGQTRLVLGAVLRFAIIFGVFLIPWPGWNDLYSAYFRALGESVFGHTEEQRIVTFEPRHMEHGFSSLDTKMTLSNRALLDSSGHGRAKATTLDTRSIGWIPTALTLALILATPVSWKQRGWALVWGLVLVHLFILFSLQVWIWDYSADVSLMAPSPFLQRILDEMDYTLITQLGASFSVPILIWIVVTIRKENLFALLDEKKPNRT
jgi:4-amino-4-deoxy-L-arabinose transferase-like glycosyltransferase